MSQRVRRLPEAVVACVGGGAMLPACFIRSSRHSAVELIGVEAGGRGAPAGRARLAAHLRATRRARTAAIAT